MAELASKTEQIKNLQVEIQLLRKKHEEELENARGEVADLKHRVSHETGRAQSIQKEVNDITKKVRTTAIISPIHN